MAYPPPPPPPPRKEPPPAAMDDDDNEISVFDAKKYYYHFNDTTTTTDEYPPPPPPQQQRWGVVALPPLHYGPLLQSSTTARSSSVVVEEGYGQAQFWARPSLSEETSPAASSDTALLNNVIVTTTTTTTKKKNDGVVCICWKWMVGTCWCWRKKKMKKEIKVSVGSAPEPKNANPNPMHVDDVGDGRNPPSPTPILRPPKFPRTLTVFPSGAGFPFPILGRRPPPPLPPKFVLAPSPRRHSLEIFRPSNGSISPSTAAVDVEGTSESDASSDLFEIESFMTQTTTPMDVASAAEMAYRMLGYGGGGRGRSFHEACASSPECYEPSEASIEWSVITAEGWDSGSVTNFSVSASEMGGDDVTSVMLTREAPAPQRLGYGYQDNGGGGGAGKHRVNPVFMGCPWPVGRTLRR